MTEEHLSQGHLSQGTLSHVRLNDIAAEIERRGRIGFGDVRRLERDILPHGVTCREEAEILIRLDRVASRADRSWNEWFVSVMVDYVVWSERPTAIVNEAAAVWLSVALEEPVPTRNGGRLVRAIVSEAERVHERLTAQLNISDPAVASAVMQLAA